MFPLHTGVRLPAWTVLAFGSGIHGAASVRLFRLVGEVVYAIEAGVFHPNPGWQCKDCQFRSACWAWR